MGLISRLFALRRTVPPPDDGKRIFITGRTQAGVYVTPDTALKNAVVWACVQYLTKAVGQLPWRVMKELPDGRGSELVPSNGVDYLLHHRPCPEIGSFAWRQAMLGNAMLWGNAYAEIERDNANRPIALWPIHPERVCAKRDTAGRLYYEVRNYTGGTIPMDPADIFHVRGFGDGVVGYNVIEYAAQSIGWAQATEIFGASYFGNGAEPGVVFEFPKALSPEGLKAFMAEYEARHRGPQRAKKPFVADAGAKVTKLGSEPNDAQFIETRQHQVEEICRWFGVPPHKVMHLLRATFSNIEHQSIEVVVDSVVPWVKAFEEEANYKLFGQNRTGLYTKMNLSGLLRGDFKSRAEGYKIFRDMGVLSANDILRMEDMNPIGPEGDKRLVQLNLTTLERVGEESAPAEEPQAPVADLSAPNGSKANGRGLPH